MKRFLYPLVLLLLAPVLFAEVINYTYDTAGRLTAANYGAGKSSTFQYDPTGNLTRSTDSLVTDSDNDGMEDPWELSFFSTLARNGTNDFDLDGMSDLAEFFAGTNPTNSSSLLRMSQLLTNSVLQTTVSWQSVSGKTYRFQFKDSLSIPGWNDLPGDTLATGPTATRNDTTTPGQPLRFYRVQIVP